MLRRFAILQKGRRQRFLRMKASVTREPISAVPLSPLVTYQNRSLAEVVNPDVEGVFVR